MAVRLPAPTFIGGVTEDAEGVAASAEGGTGAAIAEHRDLIAVNDGGRKEVTPGS